MRISVVIAAYNEAQNFAELTDRLVSTLEAMPQVEWELIYVIEGTDDTFAIAQSFAQRQPAIKIIYQSEPSGLSEAFRKGFDAVAADRDLVITMDADLNHHPEEIPRLVQRLEESRADIVIGSRKVTGSSSEGIPLWKHMLSDSVNRVMRRLASMPAADLTSGYRIYRTHVLRSISYQERGFAFLPEILMRAHALGFQMIEEPIRFTFRTAGKSKMALAPTALSYVSLFLRQRRYTRAYVSASPASSRRAPEVLRPH